MTRSHLIHLGTLLLLSSSMVFANSVQVKKFNALYADGGAMITGAVAAPAFTSLTTINLGNIYNLTNTGGTLTFNPTTQTLTLTSTITEIFSGSKVFVGDFGTITFTTGSLTSGTLLGYATFGTGTLTITTNGTDGLPNGTYFSGQFNGPDASPLIRWHEIGKTNNYYLDGFSGAGQTHEFLTWTGGNNFTVTQGATIIPEPATFALLGTGLAALFAATWMRKKLHSSPRL